LGEEPNNKTAIKPGPLKKMGYNYFVFMANSKVE
jgi:hypothetical protein